jgi:hypothetical protein
MTAMDNHQNLIILFKKIDKIHSYHLSMNFLKISNIQTTIKLLESHALVKMKISLQKK